MISTQISEMSQLREQVRAIDKIQAIARFTMDGQIEDANPNFLKVMGYSLGEIKGKHHSMFVARDYAQSPEYRQFWERLRNGHADQAEYKRIAKDGSEVWLLASYNPLFDEDGRPNGVIKFATDITQEKLRNMDSRGKIDAIYRVQGVIEFDKTGTILTANPLFLDLMGYTLPEIQGKHHSIFVDPSEVNTDSYKKFWQDLAGGKADSRVYRRYGKNGKKVWIQASYNPIFDLDGRPVKVVKFATDLTSLIEQTEFTQSAAQSLAAANEELSSSIGEISRNMELSQGAAHTIASVAGTSGEQSTRLLTSMKSMERIVSLIKEIAGRVNMLALNATIEAARAGEAGKGFAVVATEVKSLSDQTAKAANEIGREIADVQRASQSVATSIEDTLASVTQLDEYVSSVATAMVEQTSVTKEIAEHASRLVNAVGVILDQTRKSN